MSINLVFAGIPDGIQPVRELFCLAANDRLDNRGYPENSCIAKGGNSMKRNHSLYEAVSLICCASVLFN